VIEVVVVVWYVTHMQSRQTTAECMDGLQTASERALVLVGG